MPPAAAAPVRKRLGSGQKTGKQDSTPAVPTDRATIDRATWPVPSRAEPTMPAAPHSAAMARCQRRSPLRSEWMPLQTIATAPVV